MALTYDLRTVKGDIRDKDGYLKPATEWVIWETMHVGINKITDKNKDEFLVRHKLACQTAGCEPYLEAEAIEAMVGLETNASALSRAKFKTSLKRRIENHATSAFWKLDNPRKVSKMKPAERFDR